MSENSIGFKDGLDIKNRIIWILLVMGLWYIVIFSGLGELFFSAGGPINSLADRIGYEPDAFKFVNEYYLSTLPSFVGFFVFAWVTRRNRFVFRTHLPGYEGNRFRQIVYGLIVGFAMNFGCIACALVNGDIKLYLNFALSQIPFFVYALVCVFIQSSSEEIWTRGFIYERVNVKYPLWVAIVVNGLLFAALHLGNPGVSALPIIDIAVCGLSFSLAKWYTKSIWFPMGIHTGWNFTQNLLFGLPNSGLVSEASVFGLDAASARNSLVYNVGFGVEGAFPAVLADAILGIVCLVLAAKQGRLGELTQIKGKVYEADLPPKEEEEGEVSYVYVGETSADPRPTETAETSADPRPTETQEETQPAETAETYAEIQPTEIAETSAETQPADAQEETQPADTPDADFRR